MRIKEIYNDEETILKPRSAYWNSEYGYISVTNMRIMFEQENGKVRSINLEQTSKFSMDFGVPRRPKLVVENKTGKKQIFEIPRGTAPMSKYLDSIRKKFLKYVIDYAKERESALDYASAVKIWEDLGKIKEAARVRKLSAEMGSVKVAQNVVQGDQITKTEIKDSVVSKSNIGSGGEDKFAKLEKLTEMKKEGLIDDDEFKQMKKEILGK